MRAGRGTRVALGAVVLMVVLVVAPGADARPKVHPSGHALGLVPRYGGRPFVSPLFIPQPLDYHGGPVLHGMNVRTIFWEPSGHAFPPGYKSLVNQFYADVAHDSGQPTNPYSSTIQYPDGTGPAFYRSRFAGSFTVADPLPLSDCTDPAYVGPAPPLPPPCIQDQDLTAEIAKVMADNGLAPNGSDYYALYLGPDIVDCAPSLGGPPECSTNTYCAYHSSFSEGSNPVDVLYANEPYPLDPSADPQTGGCDTGASPNGVPSADDIIDTSSHEQNETVTDPLGTGWWDSSSGFENGDNCNFDFGAPMGGSGSTSWNAAVNGDHYWIQREWSNDNNACVLQYQDPIAGGFGRTVQSPEVGETVTFEASTSDFGGSLNAFRWSFGDGVTSPVSSTNVITHAFSAPGAYTVTLTAADNRRVGGSDDTITVRPGPVAAFTGPSSATSGAITVFDGSESSSSSPIYGYVWSFGDGTTATRALVRHAFAQPGAHTVTLTVTDVEGVSAMVQRTTTVINRPPTAVVEANPLHVVAGRTVTFDGRGSFDPDGNVVTYGWSFGDGSSASGARVRHVYRHSGLRTLTLTVHDNSGATASTSVRVRVTAAAACIVPGLRGLSVRQARSRLAASHCTLGRVGHAHSARVAAGHVLSSSPARAAHRAHGARVSVTISTGP
jgi:PKD repeat protein